MSKLVGGWMGRCADSGMKVESEPLSPEPFWKSSLIGSFQKPASVRDKRKHRAHKFNLYKD